MKVNPSANIAFGVLTTPKQTGTNIQNKQLSVSTPIKDTFSFSAQNNEKSRVPWQAKAGNAIGGLMQKLSNPMQLIHKSNNSPSVSLAATDISKNAKKENIFVG